MASIDHPVEFTLEFLKQLKEKKTKEERNEIFEKWLSGPIDEDVKHTAHIFYNNSINDLESLYKFFNTTDILTISAEKTLHPNRTDKRKKYYLY